MTALNTSLFFSGSKMRIFCLPPLIFALLFYTYSSKLFGNFISVKYKVIIFTTNSETHVMAFLRIQNHYVFVNPILNPILNYSKIVAFLTLSIVLPIECKVLSSAKLLNLSSGYKNKFKKILKSSGPKMDFCGTPAIISDHEL